MFGKILNYFLVVDMGGFFSWNSDVVSGYFLSSSKVYVFVGRVEVLWFFYGWGYVFLFFLFVLFKEFMCVYLIYVKDFINLLKFVGGVGGLVVIDYYDSLVGLYKELVFILGLY